LAVAAVELDAADVSDVIRRFGRSHELVRIGRPAGALDCVGDDVDHVVRRVADIGRRDAVLVDVGLGVFEICCTGASADLPATTKLKLYQF
jgi:hypothetical protein